MLPALFVNESLQTYSANTRRLFIAHVTVTQGLSRLPRAVALPEHNFITQHHTSWETWWEKGGGSLGLHPQGSCMAPGCAISQHGSMCCGPLIGKKPDYRGWQGRTLTRELSKDSHVLLPRVGNVRGEKIPSSCMRAACHSWAICSTCNINQEPVVRSYSSAFDESREIQINEIYAANGLSVRCLSSSVTRLHGQGALQGDQRHPCSPLVF